MDGRVVEREVLVVRGYFPQIHLKSVLWLPCASSIEKRHTPRAVAHYQHFTLNLIVKVPVFSRCDQAP